MSKKDKKIKKTKKGKKRVSKPRGLPSAVKGLLQYLGGQDAVLQQTPRPRGATGADSGETLTRYLSAKTASLDAMRQAYLGVNVAVQAEERLMAKRQMDEAEKKISLLSAGLKEDDTQRQKAIAEQRRKIAELESVVRQQGVDILFREMRNNPNPPEYSLRSSQAPSYLGKPPSEPDFMRGPMSEYSLLSSSGSSLDDESMGEKSMSMDSSPASELYLANAPTGNPIIRDKPRAGGGAAAVMQPPKKISVSVPKAEKSSTNISADALRSRIKQATGLAKSKYKLPSRSKYASIQAVLQNTSGSSADIINALKEAGVNLAEV